MQGQIPRDRSQRTRTLEHLSDRLNELEQSKITQMIDCEVEQIFADTIQYAAAHRNASGRLL
ncbi:MAG: hypothetical protein HC873_14855 [Leptolyngbyaceae cyanobacterium SL_1_1]|nr:hypothetical protein [Leptolyngbyaceae cyanobacterium RM1_1_2]NJO10710.1 hypothetical protein [Leptolyngbyaceae cyanobacterium SL_1_1]